MTVFLVDAREKDSTLLRHLYIQFYVPPFPFILTQRGKAWQHQEGGGDMTDKVKEILCKQLQLLAEESENMRNDVQNLCELTKVMTALTLQLSALLEHDSTPW